MDTTKGSAKPLGLTGTFEDVEGKARPNGSESVHWSFGDVRLETIKGTRDTPTFVLFTGSDGFRDFEGMKDSICLACGVGDVKEAIGRKLHIDIKYTSTVSKKDGKTYENAYPTCDKAIGDAPIVEVPYTMEEVVGMLEGMTPAEAIRLRGDPKIGPWRDVVAVKPVVLEKLPVEMGADGKYHKKVAVAS